MSDSVKEIEVLCKTATVNEVASIHEKYDSDERAGVKKALTTMDKRIEKEIAERKRVEELYEFERVLRDECGTKLSVGLDEVGRGPLAGPLSIGAVVFEEGCEPVWGINDSKKLSEQKREELSKLIKENALAYDVISITASEIDEVGISSALRKAFKMGIESVEKQLSDMGRTEEIGLVILDGNPMGIDEREVNIIKGDAKVASISAASIIAKVERDSYMIEIDDKYPEYGFAGHKGYGAASHIDAIKEHGLTPEHRATFCKNFISE